MKCLPSASVRCQGYLACSSPIPPLRLPLTLATYLGGSLSGHLSALTKPFGPSFGLVSGPWLNILPSPYQKHRVALGSSLSRRRHRLWQCSGLSASSNRTVVNGTASFAFLSRLHYNSAPVMHWQGISLIAVLCPYPRFIATCFAPGKPSTVVCLEKVFFLSVKPLMRLFLSRTFLEAYVAPHCVVKFSPAYGPLYWSQTWAQLHMCSLDRRIIDLNWQIAHGVLYTGARLALDFNMANINPRCFCNGDEETLEHVFFQCALARLLIAWVFSRLLDCDPTAVRFTVQELLFGFFEARRRAIPSIILYMLQVMKHTIWVARCDFHFRHKPPVPYECLQWAKAKLKFILSLLGRRCRSPSQICTFGGGSGSHWELLGTLRGRSWSSPSDLSLLFLLIPV